MITVLNSKIKVETKRESELVYEATNLATCNANLAVAIAALKNITHDLSQSCFLTPEQEKAVRALIESFK